jgi:hypothetical protein
VIFITELFKIVIMIFSSSFSDFLNKTMVIKKANANILSRLLSPYANQFRVCRAFINKGLIYLKCRTIQPNPVLSQLHFIAVSFEYWVPVTLDGVCFKWNVRIIMTFEDMQGNCTGQKYTIEFLFLLAGMRPCSEIMWSEHVWEVS